jgi:dTDP-glucose pyrophosphorylase
VDEYGYVTEVAEKNPISDIATCGIYWYRKGSEFVSCAETMIHKNIRVNNEFYIAPVYNELIHSGKTLIPFFVHKMHGIGTPEDLNTYLRSSST